MINAHIEASTLSGRNSVNLELPLCVSNCGFHLHNYYKIVVFMSNMEHYVHTFRGLQIMQILY